MSMEVIIEISRIDKPFHLFRVQTWLFVEWFRKEKKVDGGNRLRAYAQAGMQKSG